MTHKNDEADASLATKRRPLEDVPPVGHELFSRDQSRRFDVPIASCRGATRNSMRRFGDELFRLAEEFLGEDLQQRLDRLVVSQNEVGFDPFGFDPETGRYVLAIAALLHRRYFRSEVFGIENFPAGRALVVANHSGQLPIDGLMIGSAMMLDAEPPRFARSMVEKWTAQLPFVSTLFPRIGQVVGSPDNARRLLEREESILVFPEGARGIAKTFDRRYQLANFGLGFMRLALETSTPVVPVAVIGGEEQYISIANLKPMAKLFGMPSFPVVPQLLTGMLAPLPTRYRIYFGEPMRFNGDPDDDDAVIAKQVASVRSTVQSMVHLGLKKRTSIFF
ncbi:MAG: lysophospholipid acyltransferase family protein [Myxococcota bacterium]